MFVRIIRDVENEGAVYSYREKQVAQGQYMVSDTLSPALSDCELE